MSWWDALWPDSFANPMRLLWWLVIPLLVGLYVLASRMKNRSGMRFTNTSMLGRVIGKQSQWRRHLAVALSLLSLITLTMAFAKPENKTWVPRERATVVVVLDVSLSMQAVDVKPNRMDAAKKAAQEFVDELPEKYNVALVTMSGNPAVVAPPTQDHAAVKRSIANAQFEESTAVGEAIVTGLKALEMAPRDKDKPDEIAPGAIVMLSDGTSTAGRPALQGAEEARKAKVKTYTIAYGTQAGYVDLDGKREPVPVNHEEMKQVAADTGGTYYPASDAKELKDVYENIGSSVGQEEKKVEVTGQWAGWGMLFAVLAAVCAISLGARWP